MEKRVLTGRKEIASYVQREWRTVDRWISRDRFPAKKIDGIWTSQPTLIDFWLRDRIEMAEATTK